MTCQLCVEHAQHSFSCNPAGLFGRGASCKGGHACWFRRPSQLIKANSDRACACVQTRVKILRKIADDLGTNEQLIIERNMRDVAAAERKKIDPTLMQRLRLKPAKIRTLVQGIRAIADQEEPLRKVSLWP